MEFTREPFILDDDLCLALVDKRISYLMENELKLRNIEIIKTIECKELYESIKYHPDICICNLGKGDIIVAPNVYNQYKELLSRYKFNIIKGEANLLNRYPYDIPYNIAIVGDYAIHSFKYTDKAILDYIENNKLKKINIEQGYSKCSICIVDRTSIITSDKGIWKSMKNTEIECLLIEKGHINLFEMNYGFIGGCTGLISKDKLAFCGDVKKHPDYERIKSFVESKNKEIVTLSCENLLDIGSIVPLMTRKER
ncbi:TPA: DUF6873 family GME fold protein [Clostridioides difficile]